MDTWVPPYTGVLVQGGVDLTNVQVVVDFMKIYVGPGPGNVVKLWCACAGGGRF